MQEFSVKENNLNGAKNRLDRISAELRRYSSQVSSVKNAMSYQLKSKSGIDRALNAAATNLSGCSSKASAMGDKLSYARQHYSATENDLCNVTYQNSISKPGSGSSNESGGDSSSNVTDYIKDVYDLLAKLLKGVGKLTGDKDLGFVSPLVSYLSSLFGFCAGEHKNSAAVWSSWLKLASKSATLETKLFDYLLDGISGLSKKGQFDAKWGNTMTGISILGNLFGFAGSGADFLSTYNDPNSDKYDIVSSYLKFFGSGVKTIGKTYIATEYGKKGLQFIVDKSGMYSVKYTVSEASKISAKNGNTYIAIGEAAISSIAGGYDQYGICIQDGVIDAGDVGAIGARGACDGISSLISSGTFGIVDIDGEQMYINLDNRVDNYIQNNGTFTAYIADESHPVVLRFLASECVAVKIVADEAVSGVKTVVNTIDNGIECVSAWFNENLKLLLYK